MNAHGVSTFTVFRNFSHSITDFLRISSENCEELQELCIIKGKKNLDDALKEGKGAILFTSHLGPWEVAGAYLSSLGYNIHTVALEHPSGRVTRFFSEKRRSWGIRDYPPGECAGNLLQALRNGDVVVLLVDRNFTNRGRELPFLGRKALFPDGHIVLAMRTSSPLIPCWCCYNDKGLIEESIDEPIRLQQGQENPTDIGRICLEKIENSLRSHPEQWFAFDNLWPEVRNA